MDRAQQLVDGNCLTISINHQSIPNFSRFSKELDMLNSGVVIQNGKLLITMYGVEVSEIPIPPGFCANVSDTAFIPFSIQLIEGDQLKMETVEVLPYELREYFQFQPHNLKVVNFNRSV